MEAAPKKTYKNSILRNLKIYSGAYLLILPALIYIIIICYLPLFGIVIAFNDFNIVQGLFKSPWVGFDNFVEVFSQPAMLKSIANTIYYSTIILIGTFPFPIILAILLNELRNVRFKKVVQTVSYMPHFLSWISVTGLFYTFFAMDGPFNDFLAMFFGGEYTRTNILMDAKYFLPILFFSNLWKTIGWSSIIYLAAIAGIDPCLYEAATVDGCSKLKQVWHITLPGIKTTSIIILIMSLGGLFNVNFEQVYGFQNVYTQEQTEVIGTLIYRQGIENGKFSIATAFGLSQGLVSVIVILITNMISKKVFETSIW